MNDIGTSAAIVSAIASLCAVAVSTCIALVTAWQGYENRLQNRCNKRPILVVHKIVWVDQEQDLGIVLRNRGLGPAILRRITVLFRDENRCLEADEAGYSLLERAVKQYSCSKIGSLWPDPPVTLAVDEDIPLLFMKPSLPGAGNVAKLLESINIRLEYESIYGDCQPIVYLQSHNRSESEFQKFGFPICTLSRFQEFIAAIKVLLR